MNAHDILQLLQVLVVVAVLIPVQSISGLLSVSPIQRIALRNGARHHTNFATSTEAPVSVSVSVPVVSDLLSELTAVGLEACHGILHASTARSLEDLSSLTESQINEMGVADSDRQALLRVMNELGTRNDDDDNDASTPTPTSILSTCVDGAFDSTSRRRGPLHQDQRFQATPQQEFNMHPISSTHDVFKGRMFTVEQCQQLTRMAEYHAYRGTSKGGIGWTNQIYTLTAQHMQGKEIPGFLSTTNPLFSQLIRELYDLFPNRIRRGSICFESDGEPHLVKYHGEAKGTILHTDNSEYVYITVNIALSDSSEFCGGGTYISALDETILLEQGEMLIHLGDLEHAGVKITSGVRNLCIAFLACEWEQEDLNIAKPEHARDYVA